jgi:hypothetical protein
MTITKIPRSRRIKLLDLQIHFEKQACANCEFNAAKYHHRSCGGCPAFNQLRSIGNELLNGATKKDSQKPSEVALKLETFTPEMSIRLHREGWSNKKVAEYLNIGETTYRRWKHKNGLTMKYNRGGKND